MINTQFKEEINNYAKVIGRVSELPKKSHEIEGESFFEFKVEVERLSKTTDIIPVTASQRVLPKDLKIGDTVAIDGEYRSYNKFIDEKSKLILHLFSKEIEICDKDTEHVNEVKLVGYICKQPVYRTTPLSREICDVLVAVNRVNNMKSDYIPCIFWGRNARYIKCNQVGTKMEVVGRIQSRAYTKTISETVSEEKVAYELSCQKVTVLTSVTQIEKECAKVIG